MLPALLLAAFQFVDPQTINVKGTEAQALAISLPAGLDYRLSKVEVSSTSTHCIHIAETKEKDKPRVFSAGCFGPGRNVFEFSFGESIITGSADAKYTISFTKLDQTDKDYTAYVRAVVETQKHAEPKAEIPLKTSGPVVNLPPNTPLPKEVKK